MSKFLDENGLSFLWTKIKTLISGAVSSAESKLSNYLPLTGGTMTGNLQTPKVTVTDKTSDDILLGDGSTTSLASIKGAYLPLSGGTMTGAVAFNDSSTSIVSNYAKIDYSKLYLKNQELDISETTITPGSIELSRNHFVSSIKGYLNYTTSITGTAITTSGLVTASKFVATDKSADDILLGNGTTTSLSAIKGAYLPLTGGEMGIGAGITFAYDEDTSPNTLELNSNHISLSKVKDGEGAICISMHPELIELGGTSENYYCDLRRNAVSLNNGQDIQSSFTASDLSTYTVNTHTIKGRALPGTENEDLILGSYNGTYMSTENIDDIGDYNGIIIGAASDQGTDTVNHHNMCLLSPRKMHIATKGILNLVGQNNVNITGGTTNIHATRDVNVTANDFTVIASSSTNWSNVIIEPQRILLQNNNTDGKISLQASQLHLGEYSSEGVTDTFMYADKRGVVDINNSDGNGAMIQTLTGKEVKFRVDGDNTMRLNAASGTNPGGLRVFTNIFANTDHVTDMPSYITKDTKTKLNTNSLQSLIAPLIQNAAYGSDGIIDLIGTNPGIRLTSNNSPSPVGIFKVYVDNSGSERVVIGVDENNIHALDAQLYISTPDYGECRFDVDKAIELGLLVKD